MAQAKILFDGDAAYPTFSLSSEERPAWKDTLKKDLLADFLDTFFAKNTTVRELLTTFEKIELNDRGVLEALERRHIIPWSKLIQAYLIYANTFTPAGRARYSLGSEDSRIVEHVRKLIRTVLGNEMEDHLRRNVIIDRKAKNFSNMAGTFTARISDLNSSRSNLFIGPARRNRQLGDKYDGGEDAHLVKGSVLSGRPTSALNAQWIVYKSHARNLSEAKPQGGSPRRNPPRVPAKTDANDDDDDSSDGGHARIKPAKRSRKTEPPR